jgi:hypothetical protein
MYMSPFDLISNAFFVVLELAPIPTLKYVFADAFVPVLLALYFPNAVSQSYPVETPEPCANEAIPVAVEVPPPT